jgi:hypothetical protein
MIKTSKNTFNKLKCIQINLQHSKSASLHFYKNITDLNIDIAIIQEPFACFNKFNNELQTPSVPNTYSIHHNIDNRDHAYGAIILTKSRCWRKQSQTHLAMNA